MCKIINFCEYKGLKTMKKVNLAKKSFEKCISPKESKFVTAEWFKEYMRNGLGVSKLISHVIEQYGGIRCKEDRSEYVFEDVKRDVKYYEMCPEIENKRLKAPLWVKVKGEWFFVEISTDSASLEAFKDKWTEIGNYDVKGFLVDLYGLNKQKIKRMLEENDFAGAVKRICDCYEKGFHMVRGIPECMASVSFGVEKKQRNCTYKLVELDLYEYAVLEGTEAETGDKHLVLLAGTRNPKEYAEQFRKKYENAGIPLLYGKWNPFIENWKSCISKQEKLYKRLVIAE